MIEIPYLKDFLGSIKRSSVDDFADRLNYYYTTILLLFFGIVTGAKQSFGRPIECMMPAEYPSAWSDYVREYCFVSSTYFVPKNETIDSGVPRAGHGYYQWVPFILVLQAVLIYLPNVAWKAFQRAQTIDFEHVVDLAKKLRFVMGDEHKKGLNEIIDYLIQRLRFQGSRNGSSYTGFGMKSSLLHMAAKLITIIVLLAELIYLNKTFGNGRDNFWGITMFKQGLTNTEWNESGVFPRVTFCNFFQPILGGKKDERTVQCVLMVNMINEKVFIFVWLWLAIVLIISIMTFVYSIATLYVAPFRRRSAKSYAKEYSLSDNSSSAFVKEHSVLEESSSALMMNNQDGFDADFEATLGADGIQLFKFINEHAGGVIANEVAASLYDALYKENHPSPRLDAMYKENHHHHASPRFDHSHVEEAKEKVFA